MTAAAIVTNAAEAIADSDVPVLDAGDEIAPGYRVVKLISRGAALDVYEVFSHERLCSCIAKTIRPDRLAVERVRRRLLLEGHLLGTLAHPHLPRAFETIDGPAPVVVLQTMVGLTLEEIIDERARRLPSTDLAHLGQQLSSAVHYLHGSGYLHLDIRPANVMAHAGIATLIDLSIARPPGRVRAGLGTRDYLAPEQAVGSEVSPATDSWGIGVTLYEAATSVVPFAPFYEDDSLRWGSGEFLQLSRDAPPLPSLRRRLHPEVAAVITACLQRDPRQRPTVIEVHDRLGVALESLVEEAGAA